MRIRTIKPEFWESESLGRVSREARLLFIGLFSCCDDSGRTRASSRLLASRLYPYDEDAGRFLERWLAELEAQGCIRRYTVDGDSYLDIPKWLSHQKIDKPSNSKLPEFADGSPKPREDSRKIALEQGTGNREQGEEQGTGSGAPPAPPVPAADPIPTKTPRMNKARPILHLLNQESGRAFRETEANLLLIAARLDEQGVTVESMMQMVRRQCAKWRNDPKMSEFLRPETLFGKTKFESYHANRNMPIHEDAGGSRHGQSAADIRRSLVAGADDVQRQAELTAARERELAESGADPW
jgi:uncharacterized phage protein (TIGR02220 family)